MTNQIINLAHGVASTAIATGQWAEALEATHIGQTANGGATTELTLLAIKAACAHGDMPQALRLMDNLVKTCETLGVELDPDIETQHAQLRQMARERLGAG